MDDGSVRVLALDKAATDTAVTGKPYAGTPTQGLASYYASYYAMWGVHVSRKSGKYPFLTLKSTSTVKGHDSLPIFDLQLNNASYTYCHYFAGLVAYCGSDGNKMN